MVATLTTFAKHFTVHPDMGTVTPPDAAMQQLVTEQIARILEQAHTLGETDARAQLHEAGKGDVQRGLSLPSPRSWVQRAGDNVSHLVDRLTAWVQDWFASDGDANDFEGAFTDFVDTTGEAGASWEIPEEIGSGMLGVWQDAGIPDIVWLDEPGSCARCAANAAQGPIPIGSEFASGHSYPPAHGRCRCQLSMP